VAGFRIVARQLAILVLRNIFFAAAAFIKIFWRILCVYFDFFLRDKLAQELDCVFAVNGAVALPGLLDVTLLTWA